MAWLCLRLLILWGREVAQDLGAVDFDSALFVAVGSLTLDVWLAVFRESTSPRPFL